MKPTLVVDSPEALARRFATTVAEESARALSSNGRFSLAVSGG
jgi:6-phosphogluconolactonase/glucosamine-6-phosphate isomerase/deaminase